MTTQQIMLQSCVMHIAIIILGTDFVQIVAISNTTSLSNPGETALLVCVARGEPTVGISWSFNGEALENTSLATIYDADVVQGGITFKQSFLQLCFAIRTNNGAYTCMASNGFSLVTAASQLVVTGKLIQSCNYIANGH